MYHEAPKYVLCAVLPSAHPARYRYLVRLSVEDLLTCDQQIQNYDSLRRRSKGGGCGRSRVEGTPGASRGSSPQLPTHTTGLRGTAHTSGTPHRVPELFTRVHTGSPLLLPLSSPADARRVHLPQLRAPLPHLRESDSPKLDLWLERNQASAWAYSASALAVLVLLSALIHMGLRGR